MIAVFCSWECNCRLGVALAMCSCVFKPCRSQTILIHLKLCTVLPPPSSSICTCILLSTSPSPDLSSRRGSLVVLFLCGHMASTGVLAWQSCHRAFLESVCPERQSHQFDLLCLLCRVLTANAFQLGSSDAGDRRFQAPTCCPAPVDKFIIIDHSVEAVMWLVVITALVTSIKLSYVDPS